MHDWFQSALGPWPEKSPLNARVTGTIEGAGVKAEKILFESRPGHTVSAVLYLPNTPPPWPGVIVPCGHSANGKAAETYQRVSILLARSGLAALCYDPIGQGERLQALKPDGKPLFAGSTAEHTKIGNGSLMVGLQTAHYRVWDGIRALDYLASRPDIDPSRLGCTGNSGGGTLTSFLMAVDDRIVAAAASCYLTSYERLLATIGPQDAEQNITGMIAAGLDHGDFLLARAPQPTMMTVATRDFFDIDGAWSTYREAKKLFGALGLGERVELFEFDDTHGFSMPRRVAATRWLQRWLLEKNDAVTEPEFAILSDQQLQASPTGQVLAMPGEKSVFQINTELAASLAGQRQKNTGAKLISVVRQRLGLEPTTSPAQFRPGGSISGEKLIETGYYTTSDNFELSAVRLRARGGKVVDGSAEAGERPLT
ncbi:MAG: alpha/beta hydrolase family protein, partial [bacterium]